MESRNARSQIIRNWLKKAKREPVEVLTEESPVVAFSETKDFNYIQCDASLEVLGEQFVEVLRSFHSPLANGPDWKIEIIVNDKNQVIYITSESNQLSVALHDEPDEDAGKLEARLSMCFEDLRLLTNFEDDLMSIMMRNTRLDQSADPTIRPISDMLFGAYNLHHLGPEFRGTLIEKIYGSGIIKNLSGARRLLFPWSIAADIGSTLHRIIVDRDCKKSLEIGLAYGMSALFMCQAHQRKSHGLHTAIDPCQSVEFQSMGVDQVKQAGLEDYFRFFEERDFDILPALAKDGEKFDFIFIDGLHMHDYVVLDYFYSDILLDVDGIVVFDDCQLPGVSSAVAFFEKNRNYEYVEEYSDQRIRAYRKKSEDDRTILNPNHHVDYYQRSYEISGSKNELLTSDSPIHVGSKESIAVVGIDASVPNASSVEELWGAIEFEKVLYEAYTRDYLYSRQKGDLNGATIVGGLLAEPFEFDPKFFKISRSEAELMDPQLRQLLMSVYRSIEDSGYTLEQLSEKRVGVFIGNEGSDYNELNKEQAIKSGYILNYSGSILANRISNVFNFHGPSEVINTMCSSGAFGIYRAMEQIRNNEIDFAVVAAVKMNFSEISFQSLIDMNITSANDRCYSFHEDSAGYIRSEGMVSLLLTSKRQAKHEKDHVYAHVKEAAANFNGRDGHSMFAPSKNGQKEVIKNCYQKAGVSIGDVTYIEAQGMGNEISDFVEFNAINEACKELSEETAFTKTRTPEYPTISTIKPILGHMECVSALGALLRIILCMKSRTLYKVPELSKSSISSKLDSNNSPCKLQIENISIPVDEPILVGLNSFGASGTNVHLLVEEGCKNARVEEQVGLANVLPISARSRASLIAYVQKVIDFLSDGETDVTVGELCFTFQNRRQHFDTRAAFYVPAEPNQAQTEGLVKELASYVERVKSEKTVAPEHSFAVAHARDAGSESLAKNVAAWLEGSSVDWASHYSGKKLRKVDRLPTYPFDCETIKLPQSSEQLVFVEDRIASYIHPLVHTNVSNLSQQAFDSRFSGEEFYLRDHQVNEEKVLPAVAYLEMARAAISNSTAYMEVESDIELLDVVWEYPVVVKRRAKVTISIEPDSSASDNAQRLLFSIYSMAKNQKLVHCRGKARLMDKNEAERHDLDRLHETLQPSSITPELLYENYHQLGVDYGSTFQGVTSINHSDDEVLAELDLPTELLSTFDEYGLHPTLLDSALQASVGLLADSQKLPERPLLPFILNRLTICSKFTTKLFARIRSASNESHKSKANGQSKPGESTEKVDIDLVDQDGLVCAKIRGFTFRELRGALVKQKPSNTKSSMSASRVYSHDMALLQDHKIGAPVLMGAAYLSLMFELGATAASGKQIHLDRILYTNPLELDVGESAEVKVETVGNSQSVSLRASYAKASDKAKVQTAEGVLQTQSLPFDPKRIDIQKLIDGSDIVRHGDSFYTQSEQLYYGESLFSVKEVYKLEEGKVMSRVVLSDTMKAELPQYIVHPCIFDACFVTTAFALTEEDDDLVASCGLPMLINQAAISADLEKFQATEYYSVVQQVFRNEKIAKQDMEIYSQTGELLIVLRGATTGFSKNEATSSTIEPEASVAKSKEQSVNAATTANGKSHETPISNPVENTLEDGKNRTRSVIVDVFCDAMKMDRTEIHNDHSFADYGVDSITGVNAVRQINDTLDIELDMTSLFEYSTVNLLAEYIYSNFQAEIDRGVRFKSNASSAKIQQSNKQIKPLKAAGRFLQTAVSEPDQASHENTQKVDKSAIAIIGMSGRFAKSDSVEELWEHISAGTDLTEEVSRWPAEQCQPGGGGNANYCSRGSFIEAIDLFDAKFFRISDEEALYMDPQQRLFLEESWRALEDAGYAGASINGKECGVYVGCGDSNYEALFQEAPPAQAFWGNSASVIPARIAYHLNLHGPAMAVDTSCSSSLVAVHLACQGLWSQETDLALAGGVFVQATSGFYQVSNRAGMLSPKGKCFSFDERADGIVPGEGVGVLVLKRLSDALADGDHIHGVIAGSGVNQDGSTNGITAPSSQSQVRLETSIYSRFEIDPATIQVIEAHGTGTPLGDSIEVSALKQVFKKYTDKQSFCAIGSVKSNLGHAAGAAGVIGIIKLLLALRHQQIPPSINFKSTGPAINLDASPFYVNTELQKWPCDVGEPRRAAISSFGFSGTNAHLVLESAPESVATKLEKPAYLIALSAQTEKQLRNQVKNLRLYLMTHQSIHLGDLSFTLLAGRTHFPIRLACVVTGQNDLLSRLDRWYDEEDETDVFVYKGERKEASERPSLKRFANQCLQDCSDEFSSGNPDAEIYKENLTTVAELHVQGYDLDIHKLYSANDSRLSLPTYPFERNSYWVKTDEHTLQKNEPRDTSSQSLVPTGIYSHESHTGFRFRCEDSHQVDGRINGQNSATVIDSLDISTQLNMLQPALLHLGGAGKNITVRELKIPPQSNKVNATSLELIVLKQSTSGVDKVALPFEIFSRQGSDTVVHAQGKIEPLLAASAGVSLSALQDEVVDDPRTSIQLHTILSEIGVSQASLNYKIESAAFRESQVLAAIAVPTADHLHNDVSAQNYDVLNSVWLVACLGLHRSGQKLLGEHQPIAIGGISSFSEIEETAYVWSRQSAQASNESKQSIILDIDVFNERGEACLQIRAAQFPKTTIEAAVSAQAPWRFSKSKQLLENEKSYGIRPLKKIEVLLKQEISKQIDRPIKRIAGDINFFDLGMSSLGIAHLVQNVNEILEVEIQPSTIFDHRDVTSLAAYIVDEYLETVEELNSFKSTINGHQSASVEHSVMTLTPFSVDHLAKYESFQNAGDEVSLNKINIESDNDLSLDKVLWHENLDANSYDKVTL